jgi:hypothetical protein
MMFAVCVQDSVWKVVNEHALPPKPPGSALGNRRRGSEGDSAVWTALRGAVARAMTAMTGSSEPPIRTGSTADSDTDSPTQAKQLGARLNPRSKQLGAGLNCSSLVLHHPQIMLPAAETGEPGSHTAEPMQGGLLGDGEENGRQEENRILLNSPASPILRVSSSTSSLITQPSSRPDHYLDTVGKNWRDRPFQLSNSFKLRVVGEDSAPMDAAKDSAAEKHHEALSTGSCGSDLAAVAMCRFACGPRRVLVFAGPVKGTRRMREKLVEYAREGMEWPLCAQILDPVRTSVVCSGPAQILEARRTSDLPCASEG